MTADAGSGATPFGGTLALAVAVVTVLTLGGAVGLAGASAAGCAGALLLVAAAERVERDDNADRAAASVAAFVGVLSLAAGLALAVTGVALTPAVGRFALVLVASTAVLSVGLAGRSGYFRTREHGLATVLGRSGFVFAFAAVVTATVAGVVSAAPLVVEHWTATTGASTFALLVALQVEGILVAFLLAVSVPAVEGWTRTDDGPEGATARLGDGGPVTRPALVPYYVLLGIQAVLAVLFPGALDDVLSVLPVVGPGVRAVLELRVLHTPLELLGLVLVLVLAVEALRVGVVVWAEPDPPRTVADAAGAGIATVLILVAGALPPTAGVVAGAVPSVSSVPPTAVALFVLAAGFVVLYAPLAVVAPPPMNPRETGFAVGAAALFACAIGGALAGAVAPVAFGVAAAAFVVWDVGATAVDLGATLGPDADTVRGEFVRAGASTAVGVAALLFATAVLYVLGPLSVSVPPWRGYLAMTLALLALSAFALYLARTSPQSA